MLSIGIVGLPNVGKSTLFKALTKKQVDIANYPFTTIDPNVGVVGVPDKRLEEIVRLLEPKESYPAVVEFIDIAGLIKDAHKGEGLGNQFLSHIYAVDAILFLIRLFKDKDTEESAQDPEEELLIIKNELEKKDEEITKRDSSAPLLSKKPFFIACNRGKDNLSFDGCNLEIDAKMELEMSEMNKKEVEELGLESDLPKLIRKAYETLNLISFYTIKGGKEIRAWPIEKGTNIYDSAEVVHSDFKEKFIRAEVIQWSKLLETGGPVVNSSNPWQKAREKGWIKTEGKDYTVQDGDVIEFKI